MGDVDTALKKSEGDPQVNRSIRESIEHLSNVDKYKKAYGHTDEGQADLPPEVNYQVIPMESQLVI